MKRLVLIDGINFFYRGAWKGGEIWHCNGKDMSYVVIFFRNLANMMENLGKDGAENTFAICWDGGYAERLRISTEAVEKGLIPKAYKQERREARETEDPEEKEKQESFFRQMDESKKILPFTSVREVFVKGEEADDLIGSLARKYKSDFDEVLLVTTDKDYYQLIGENIRIYSSGDNSYKDAAYLKSEYNLDSPSQWIDVGALAGETGKSSDTIYGAPGIGYKIASRLISEYGTLDNLLESSKDALEEDIRNCGGEKELYDKVKSHEYKLKHHVKEMYAVSHKEVVLLARRLKAIRTFLDIELPKNTADWVALDQTFKKIGIPASTKMLDALTK